MVAAHTRSGDIDAAYHVFAGLVEIGVGCFNSMTSRYKLELRIEHYGCLIDLLGRAGYLRRALAIVMHVPFEPSAAIWGSILAAACS